jgi:hypothetical protein
MGRYANGPRARIAIDFDAARRRNLATLLLVIGLDARAQAEGERARLGVGLLVGLPLASLGESAVLGGLLGAEIRLGAGVSLTARGGYARVLGGEAAIIPLWVGAHLLSTPGESSTAFFALELGLNIVRDGSEGESLPGLNVGGGVDVGASSLGLFLSVLDVQNLANTAVLAGTFTFHFLAL